MKLRGCLQRPVAAPPSGVRGGLKRLVFDERGVRSWIRALLFIGLFALILVILFVTFQRVISFFPELYRRIHAVQQHAKAGGGLPPWIIILDEVMLLGCTMLATWVMTRLDGSPFAGIGLPRARWLRDLAAGCAVGFCMIGLLVAGLLAFGFGRLEPPTAGFAVALRSGLEWAVAALLIGFTEEIAFRGYLFAILRERYGFWIGALVVTGLFMSAHGHNPDENLIGLLTTAVVSVLFCLAILRTCAVWWVIGCHAAWDWAESYFFGSADSGMYSSGRLFTLLPHGNAYLSGGTDGPEGSLLCLVVLIAVILALPLLIRRRSGVPGLRAALDPAGKP